MLKSVRTGIERLKDLTDEGIYYVKRKPLRAVAIAAGMGLMAGLAAGRIFPSLHRRAGQRLT